MAMIHTLVAVDDGVWMIRWMIRFKTSATKQTCEEEVTNNHKSSNIPSFFLQFFDNAE